jgi:hypothetical protein
VLRPKSCSIIPHDPHEVAKMKTIATLICLFCFCTLTVGYAQTQVIDGSRTPAQDKVQGATAEFTSFDSAREMGTFRIKNTSGKEIRAYAVARMVTFQNGKTQWSGESMKDFGPPYVGEGLHPGAVEETEVNLKSPNVKAEARVTAVVYADLTCEWSDSAALSRIEDHRKSEVIMEGIRVEAIKAALAESADDHPGPKAASIIRQRIPTDRASVDALARREKLSPFANGAAGLCEPCMEDYAKRLEQEPREAIRAGRSERDYLGDELARAEEQYQAKQEYAQIRRRP